MKVLHLFVLSLALTLPCVAATKTLTVLGDKKVKTKWEGDMPKAMTDRGIETNVTGIIIAEGKLVPTFGFDVTTKKKILKVSVEDVTGKEAVMMVEDAAPVIEDSHWKGYSSPRELTPAGVPWLYTPGATLMVYRFTVSLEGDAQPVVIYQPSVFRESSKIRLRDIAAQLNQR